MFITRPVESWQDTLDQMTLWRKLLHQIAPDNPFIAPLWSKIWFNTQLVKKRRKAFLFSSTNEGAEGIILLSRGSTKRLKLKVKCIESIGTGTSANDRHLIYEQEPLLTKKAIDLLLESIKAIRAWAFLRLAPLSANYPFFEDFITAAKRHGMTLFRRP